VSRGPGRTMRAVLDYLTTDARASLWEPEHWHGLHHAAGVVWFAQVTGEPPGTFRVYFGLPKDYQPPEAVIESVRRAVKSLERDGCVTIRRPAAGFQFRLTAEAREKLSADNYPTLTPEEATRLVAQLQDAIGGQS
jgi:hypothetical protein